MEIGTTKNHSPFLQIQTKTVGEPQYCPSLAYTTRSFEGLSHDFGGCWSTNYFPLRFHPQYWSERYCPSQCRTYVGSFNLMSFHHDPTRRRFDSTLTAMLLPLLCSPGCSSRRPNRLCISMRFLLRHLRPLHQAKAGTSSALLSRQRFSSFTRHEIESVRPCFAGTSHERILKNDS